MVTIANLHMVCSRESKVGYFLLFSRHENDTFSLVNKKKS